MQDSTFAGINFSNFSSFNFKENPVFTEQKDIPVEKGDLMYGEKRNLIEICYRNLIEICYFKLRESIENRVYRLRMLESESSR